MDESTRFAPGAPPLPGVGRRGGRAHQHGPHQPQLPADPRRRAPVRAVLQAVSAIFSPAIQDNIAAVTARLAERGLVTPRLLPTQRRRRCTWTRASAASGGCRRTSTASSFDVVGSAEQARAAGELVGRFHARSTASQHAFVGTRAGVHDTPRAPAPPGRGGGRARRPSPGRRRAAARRRHPRRRRRAAAAARAGAARLPRRSQVQQHPVRGARSRPTTRARCA